MTVGKRRALSSCYYSLQYEIKLFALHFNLLVMNGAIPQPGDVLIIHANIMTASKKGERKQPLVIRDGLVSFTGDNNEALRCKVAAAKVTDAKGRTIIPDFNDVHQHPYPETPFTQ